MSPRELPIWRQHQAIIDLLRVHRRLVLMAATGSGKSTQVPQMIRDSGLVGDGRIVVLQPRRVAARTVAVRVAAERGVRIGTEVGYQVRFDDALSDESRICFVTEGILLRWLQRNPQLGGVGAVIFDEFHERNLLSDAALGLVRQLQLGPRPDLLAVVMSATLDAAPVARYLENAPTLAVEGRMFPVSIRWSEYGDERSVAERAADAVERIVNDGEAGDVLVFMPGMGEIQSTLNALRSAQLPERCLFLPLHGDLAPEEQDRAFQQSPMRRIIVATNVAETSVTIDGVRHVVDSGQARIARFDAERGLPTLGVEEISRASAEQRAGRAGRTAPGTCWRLWTESGHLNREERQAPEIQRADLSEVVLLLHSLGVAKAAEFPWLDRPETAAVERAESLLKTLGAISNEGRLTDAGWEMKSLPVHPRYARMLIEARHRKCLPAAALCAALASGRDLLLRPGRDDRSAKEARELFEGSALSDFYTLMRAHQFARNCRFDSNQCRRYGIRAEVGRQVEDTYRQLLQVAGSGPENPESSGERTDEIPEDALRRCLLAGFPDQMARRRDLGTLDCQLAGGRQGVLARESVVVAPLMVVAGLREVELRGGPMPLLTLASAVEVSWLSDLYPQHLTSSVEHVYDRTHKRVAAIRQTRFLGLLVAEDHQREVDPVASGRALADAFSKGWFELPQLGHDVRQFIARVNFVSAALPELEFPPMDGGAVCSCLTRAFHGLTLAKEAQGVDLLPSFRAHLAAGQADWLNEVAPVRVPGPDAKPVKLLYPEALEERDEEAGLHPETQIKLQECWGMEDHPTVAEGRVPVRIWLQAPDGKRLDSTLNWKAWKAGTYPRIRPQLRVKFPGFVWP